MVPLFLTVSHQHSLLLQGLNYFVLQKGFFFFSPLGIYSLSIQKNANPTERSLDRLDS